MTDPAGDSVGVDDHGLGARDSVYRDDDVRLILLRLLTGISSEVEAQEEVLRLRALVEAMEDRP